MLSFQPIADLLSQCIEVSRQTLPGEAVIGVRLLSQRDRLADTFHELTTKLASEDQLRTFLGLVMSSAAPWSLSLEPRQAAKRVELLHLNRRIASVAQLLGPLMRRREELRGTPGFAEDTLYWPADVLGDVFKRTGKHTGVTDGLAALQSRYDTTQWPSMPDACKVITMNAEAAPTPADLAFEAVSDLPLRERARRFVHTLLGAMLIGNEHLSLLPVDFEVSDASLATLTNVVLDLHSPHGVIASEMRGIRPWIYAWEEEP